MIIEGKLIKCRRESKEFRGQRGKEKLYLSLAEVTLDDFQMDILQDAFMDSGRQFTPDWIQDFKGYVNLATEFELPARLPDGKEVTSIESEIENGFNAIGADVRVSVKTKDGAVYPSAIVFDSEGTPINPFSEFDETL